MKTNWKAIREVILERCGNYCEACGKSLTNDFALHHRLLRSRGGKDSIENLVALHHECHNLGTHAVHFNINKSTELGLIVPTRQDPATYPLILPNGSIVTLTPEGSYNYLDRKANYGW